jgi:hypothetical protein
MSTSPTPCPKPVPAEPAPSRPVLDEKKKAKIIALLANGSSRRMASRFVGCAASTIARTAARDPTFREQLATAEQNVDIDALRAVRAAAHKTRHWRAAAWLLERRNPDDFARRTPETYTASEFASLLTAVMDGICDDLPEENYQRVMKKLEQLCEGANQNVQADKAAPRKMPDLEKEWANADLRRQPKRLPGSNKVDHIDFKDDLDDDFKDEPSKIPSHSAAESPLVQHPSSAETPPPFPTLAVTPETPYTSELPL